MLQEILWSRSFKVDLRPSMWQFPRFWDWSSVSGEVNVNQTERRTKICELLKTPVERETKHAGVCISVDEVHFYTHIKYKLQQPKHTCLDMSQNSDILGSSLVFNDQSLWPLEPKYILPKQKEILNLWWFWMLQWWNQFTSSPYI